MWWNQQNRNQQTVDMGELEYGKVQSLANSNYELNTVVIRHIWTEIASISRHWNDNQHKKWIPGRL